ncbi:hypothetical protein [Massilia sp. YIM B04103]|uniref:hypothetical protein n=1 Tax=Massilia sp. YIM B04103 TaxID=2963106 RepID=UPI00210B251C|nr:hypothetical protein [Massilia sp. YIM B04103]
MSLRTIGFSGLLLAWSCAIAEEAPSVSLKKGLPPDAAALVERWIGCEHFAGEEPYDADRKREIAAAMRKLKCDRLERDELKIQRRYATRPTVLKALRQARESGS